MSEPLSDCSRADPAPITVLIVHGHRMLGEGLRVALGRGRAIEIVGLHTDLRSSLADVGPNRPDVLLVAYLLIGAEGARQALEQARERHPGLKLLVLTASDDRETLRTCLELGAVGTVNGDREPSEVIRFIRWAQDGVLLVPAETILDAINGRPPSLRSNGTRDAHHPAPTVTTREREVLELLAMGLSTDEVARRLSIAPSTVRSHTQNLLGRFQVRSKLQAVVVALRDGVIDFPAGPQ